MSGRSALLVAHTGRPGAVSAAQELTKRLAAAGFAVRVLESEAADLALSAVEVVAAEASAADGAELVIALGGDGTLLRAAELARPAGTPLLGINLGHVGFLAEVDRSDLDVTAERIVACSYDVEERLTLDVTVVRGGERGATNWALNDVSVEKVSRERMLDTLVEVDGRPLSRWTGDGIVCATPTGSTAYAFSAGGPVVWPSVQALLVVPISAHALFARPLVISPESQVAVHVRSGEGAIAFCDGRRTMDLREGDRVEVCRGAQPVRLARLRNAPFTDRLVDKFQLPIAGWRGPLD
ncbi:MAG: NAD kinase [Frankiaceae bacterium]|nr:NAD kinase [Frankiaceae bacterium]MBV9369417.1 NAD kinase [Frankiales bacterium]